MGPKIFKQLQERKVSYIILNQAAKIETELVGHRPHWAPLGPTVDMPLLAPQIQHMSIRKIT